MKKSLRALLNALDRIVEDHEEVTDTEVRERMRDAVEKAVLAPAAGYALPDAFGMFTPEGDGKVKAALARFIGSARAEAEGAGLDSRAARLRAFQDLHATSRGGNTYDEYFGYEPDEA